MEILLVFYVVGLTVWTTLTVPVIATTVVVLPLVLTGPLRDGGVEVCRVRNDEGIDSHPPRTRRRPQVTGGK